jgi:hypothetical protein
MESIKIFFFIFRQLSMSWFSYNWKNLKTNQLVKLIPKKLIMREKKMNKKTHKI